MSVTLHLGVVDVPYAPGEGDPAPKLTKKGRMHKASARRAGKAYQQGYLPKPVTTTGDVAVKLEEKYGVMQAFYEQAEPHIAEAFAHGTAAALEDLLMGSPVSDPFAGVSQEITDAFKVFLSQGTIEEMGIPGVPTKAALERRSSRFKKGRGPAQRPSFIDTGTYENSFTAWVTDEG